MSWEKFIKYYLSMVNINSKLKIKQIIAVTNIEIKEEEKIPFKILIFDN